MSERAVTPRIVVFGAGSIGCYVGGRLLAAGGDVVLLGRERLRVVIQRHGLTLSHFTKPTVTLAVADVRFTASTDCLRDADIILLTVKSQATATAAAQLDKLANRDAFIVSLQNGVANGAMLKDALPALTVAAGMVPFNVVNQGDGRFHCGTEGDLQIENVAGSAALVAQFKTAGLPTVASDDIDAVQWGKLLMNLNNAVNALADQPLKKELAQRDYRRALAMAIEEALLVLKHADIQPARVGKVAPRWLPRLLGLPDGLFKLLARGVLRIDPQARSSMWEDLQADRPPEIEYLNGSIVALGRQVGIPTPINTAMVDLVNDAFAQRRSPALGGAQLLAHLRAVV